MESLETFVPMITLRNDNCPICGSSNRLLLGKPGKISDAFKDLSEIGQVNVVRCLDCSGKYIHPMLYFSEEVLKKLYSLDFFKSNGAVEDTKNVGEKVRIMGNVKKLSGDARGKTMLDIGCGTGEFLKAAADCGFNVTGIDVNSTTTEYVVNKYGFHTITGLFGAGTFAHCSFDVVVLSHVIEHLQKPIDMLAVIYRILKPNGLFVMCTPNSDSLKEDIHNVYGRIRYGRSKSYYLSLPFFTIGFNLKSARRILENAGFTAEYCKLHSGLEWEDKRLKFIMRPVKIAGALVRKGMSIVTISRKPA